MKPHGIMFHHFCDGKTHIESQGAITAEEFEDMIKYLGNKYKLMNAIDFFNAYMKNDIDEDSVCITFDDCLKCQFDIALPILERYNIKAFWFVYSSVLEANVEYLEIFRHFRFLCFNNIEDFYDEFFETVIQKENELKLNVRDKIKNFEPSTYQTGFKFYTDNDRLFRYLRDELLLQEKYEYIMLTMIKKYNYSIEENKKILWLSKKEVKYLHDAGHLIGLHSHSHPTVLEKFDYNLQYEEYATNQEIISKIIGENAFSMSHPCNSYNSDTFKILKKLGIKLGFRANTVSGYSSNFEIPREDHSNIMKEIKKNEGNTIYQ